MPSRPLVPAPTKTMRPPLRSADAIISTPTAIRSRSRCTAASTLRSSLSIRSTRSSAASLSMPRLDGLIASVGSDCHLERGTINYNSSEASPAMHDVTPLIDAYLTHLTVERRLAANSIESYARDLNQLARFAAGHGRPVESLQRAD